MTFVDAFPKISILRGVTIPAYGGDTVWAHTAEAYERLPEPLKRLAEQLWAVHSNDYDYGADRTDTATDDRLRHHNEVFVAETQVALRVGAQCGRIATFSTPSRWFANRS